MVALAMAAHAAEIGGTELGHQLLFGVGGRAEQARVGQGGAVEPRAVPHRMHQFMKDRRVIVTDCVIM